METGDAQPLGLSSKESNLYQAALRLGVASITQLARRAGLKRPTTYLVIDSLLEKDLLIAVPRGKSTLYRAQDPQKLLSRLEDRRQALLQILPNLQQLYQASASQPKVQFYTGQANLRGLYEDVMRAKEVWGMVSPDNFLSVFSNEDNRHFFRVLTRQGGIMYDIFENTKNAREFSRENYRTGVSEVRFLPRGIHVPTDILISGNKTALVSLTNVIGVLIQDRDITTTMRTMLQTMWAAAKPAS